jgi:membrane protease YdiL (CAAX protease family)
VQQLENKSYLSIYGAMATVIILISLTVFIKLVLPFAYENFFSYPIATFLTYGGIMYVIVKGRQLNAKYLFPRKKFGESVGAFVAITISLFLLKRISTDVIQFFSIGSAGFLEAREEWMYPFKQRQLKHFFTIVILGPIMEELLFRGLFFKSFLKHYNVRIAIVMSSSLFAILHVDFDQYYLSDFLASFLFGIFLALIILKTENIRIAIGCHIFWNLLNAILLPLIFVLFNIKVSTVLDVTIVFAVMTIAAVLLLYFGYKWIINHLSNHNN